MLPKEHRQGIRHREPGEMGKKGTPERSVVHILWDNFWFLPVIGVNYGFYHTKPWATLSLSSYILVYSLFVSNVLLLGYSSYLLIDHLSLLSQAVHFLIVGLVASTASMVLTIKRKQVGEISPVFDNHHICEYSHNEYFDELCKKTTRNKNKLIVTWVVLYGTCGLLGAIQPALDNLFGVGADFPINVNGVWLNLPVLTWVPADLENSSSFWLLAYAWQGLFLSYCAVVTTSAIVLCFTVSDRLLDQLRLLIYGVNHLDRRALDMFKQRHPGRKKELMGNEFDECYYECIVQSVEHHLKIKELIELMLDIASLPIAVPFFGGAILLGMALITLTEEDDPRVGPKCLAAALAFAEAYNMYLLCRMGEEFQQVSNELYDSLFYTRWYARSMKCRKAIQIMQFGCFRPIKITAAKLLILNMSLYSDLVNSAYSIFNLKAISNDRK